MMGPDRRPFDASSAWRDTSPLRGMDADAARVAIRARRRATVLRIVEIAVPLGGLALLAEGLRHAANHLEHTLAGVAAAGLVIAWIGYSRSRASERRALGAAAPTFVQAALDHRRYEQRLAVYVWIVLAAELVFLVPWWSGGIPLHSANLFARVVVLTLWLPAAAIVALGGWSLVLWRRARREIPELHRAAAEFEDEH